MSPRSRARTKRRCKTPLSACTAPWTERRLLLLGGGGDRLEVRDQGDGGVLVDQVAAGVDPLPAKERVVPFVAADQVVDLGPGVNFAREHGHVVLDVDVLAEERPANRVEVQAE